MALQSGTLKKYVGLARSILIIVAKNRTFITYEELKGKMGGPGRGYIGEVLEEVSDSEYEKGRPLLSALVVHTVDLLPGNGWWTLRVLPPALRNASTEKKIVRWEKECRKTWLYWKKRDP